MAHNEAHARIKINKLLEEAGWRFFDTEVYLLLHNTMLPERFLQIGRSNSSQFVKEVQIISSYK
jgi:hypothetical protein